MNQLRGSNGIVWATHDLEQTETMRGAQEAQDVASEIDNKHLDGTMLYILRVADVSRIAAVVDFIWRSEVGLQLVPA